MAASRDGFTCPTASYAMTDITLVRHAESIWHAEDRYCGVTDVDLTEEGRRQTQWLARWAASANLSAVWTSPLQRCQLTADPCAAAQPPTRKIIDIDHFAAKANRRCLQA
jgi:broad specificity phosphatase PhoE